MKKHDITISPKEGKRGGKEVYRNTDIKIQNKMT